MRCGTQNLHLMSQCEYQSYKTLPIHLLKEYVVCPVLSCEADIQYNLGTCYTGVAVPFYAYFRPC